MAMQVSTDGPEDAIRTLYGCDSSFVASVPVRERLAGGGVWEGEVQIVELLGHPEADCAYTWSDGAEESGQRRFTVVLHRPPVDSPQQAVQAAFLAPKFP